MKYIRVCRTEKMPNFVTEDKIHTIQLLFKEDLQNLSCCCKKISDGCQIILWNSEIKEYCHDCFLKFFKEILTITNTKESSHCPYFTIEMQGLAFQVSNDSLYKLRSKMLYYFKELYKKHIRDDLFLKSDSKYIIKFLAKTRNVVNESETDTRKTSKMTPGKRKQFFNEKYINEDISQCYKYPFEITISDEDVGVDSIFKLEVYSVFSNIPCSISKHKSYQESVTVISDGRNYGFTFGFCAEHLLDFAILLNKAYFDSSINSYKQGEFRFEKGLFGSSCYLTKTKNRYMYKLHINQCSVILSREGILLLADKILTSSAFAEIYPIQSKQFATMAANQEVKETQQLRKYLSKEKQEKREAIESLTEYYEKLLEKNQQDILRLTETNKQLSSERDELKYQINNIDRIVQNNQRTKFIELKNKVLNCLDVSKTEITLGVKSKKAEKYKDNDLKVTYLLGFKCCTFPHTHKREIVALIEMDRPNDTFALAVSVEDAEIFLKGLTQAKINNPYIDEQMKFSVIISSDNSNGHCYFCGEKFSIQYIIKHGYVKYTLCPNCVEKYKKTFEGIIKKLNYIQLLGGKDFISKIEVFNF